MQRFPCPFCGERDEREFHFLAEAGKIRPDTTQFVDEQTWAQYLFDQRNAKGEVKEVWMHLTCKEVFVLERDTLTMDVMGSVALRKSTS